MDNERSFTVGRFDRTGPYDGITGDLGVGSSRSASDRRRDTRSGRDG
jgi:hypothetical protein